MKKILIFPFFLICLIAIFPLATFAQVTYHNVVNVSIYKSSNLTMTFTGAYQAVNKDTEEIFPIPTDMPVTFLKTADQIILSYNDFSQTSTQGFDIQELPSDLSIGQVNNGTKYRGSFLIKSTDEEIEVINYLDMEDYLKGVVPSEMPASWPMEALKAQAISARSYASHGKLLSNTATSQVYRGYSAENPRTNQAVEETSGLVVKYNNRPIQTFYHSSSGGMTANVGDVWNSNQAHFPYLVSVPSPYESSSPYQNWTETFAPSVILTSFGFTGNEVLYDVSLTKKGANGEVGAVTVYTSAGEKTISGNEGVIRGLFPLNSVNHYNKLYSNWFDISVNKGGESLSIQTNQGVTSLNELAGQTVQTANGAVVLTGKGHSVQTAHGVINTEGNYVTSIVLTGKGWGHRIGMSQYGAKGFAEQGWTAEQILTHYFRGTVVEPI